MLCKLNQCVILVVLGIEILIFHKQVYLVDREQLSKKSIYSFKSILYIILGGTIIDQGKMGQYLQYHYLAQQKHWLVQE